MDPRALLEANLSVIDDIVAVVCRRARYFGAEAEDFASGVRLALIDDDYAVLRRHQGRSSLATYLTIVIERLLEDDRNRRFGRWRPSAEAVRLGKAAVAIETLILRDRRPLEEVVPLVRNIDPALSRADIEQLVAKLPERRARPVATELEAAPETALIASVAADARAIANEVRPLANRANRVIRDALDALPVEDRALLQFRYVESMSIADISRMLRLPQRPLYRRIESLLGLLRRSLATEGIEGSAATDLLAGSALEEMDFNFVENQPDGQSRWDEAQ